MTQDGTPSPPAPRVAAARKPPSHRRDAGSAGVEGNAKLTAMTGAILLVGFAVEGFTILEIHRGSGPWLFLHKASFILWFGVMTIHVLNYAPRLPRLLAARAARGAGQAELLFSGSARWLALAVAVAFGVGVAALATHLSAKWGVIG